MDSQLFAITAFFESIFLLDSGTLIKGFIFGIVYASVFKRFSSERVTIYLGIIVSLLGSLLINYFESLIRFGDYSFIYIFEKSVIFTVAFTIGALLGLFLNSLLFPKK